MITVEHRSRTIGEVVRVAPRSMPSFFVLIGQAVVEGRSRRAFTEMTSVGVDRSLAWIIIEGWGAMRDVEMLTGWTPEIAAMESVMRTDGWREIDWTAACRRLTRKR